MPIWFYDKETETPAIYGSLRAISNDGNLSEDVLYKHFSIPSNNEEYKKLELLKKKFDEHKIININILENLIDFKYSDIFKEYLDKVTPNFYKIVEDSSKQLKTKYANYNITKSSIKVDNTTKYVIKYIDMDFKELTDISIKVHTIIMHEIDNFVKKYNDSYVDERYELYKLEIKRT